MIEHITPGFLEYLRRDDAVERMDKTALNDFLDYIAERDAEIKRLTEDNARLRAEVGKMSTPIWSGYVILGRDKEILFSNSNRERVEAVCAMNESPIRVSLVPVEDKP